LAGSGRATAAIDRTGPRTFQAAPGSAEVGARIESALAAQLLVEIAQLQMIGGGGDDLELDVLIARRITRQPAAIEAQLAPGRRAGRRRGSRPRRCAVPWPRLPGSVPAS